MAATKEGLVKDKIKKLLNNFGVYYFFPVSGGFGKSGVFDVVACYKGHFIGIEAKADPTKKPTPLQTQNAEKAHACLGTSLLIHSGNLDVLEKFLTELRDGEGAGFEGKIVWPTNCS